MTIAAKPTLYRNVQFRSRLEARWAAFFDITGWRWEYEPVDLPQWTPDFVLIGANSKTLCEVKPISWDKGEPVHLLQQAELSKVLTNRSERFSPETDGVTEIVVLGDGPQRNSHGEWVLGVFLDDSWCVSPGWAVLAGGANDNTVLDYFHETGAFRYRASGEWDGDHHIRSFDDSLPQDIWRLAGNLVQWRGKQSLPYSGPIGPLLARIARKAGEGEP